MDSRKKRRPDGEHHRHHAEEVLHVGDDRLVAKGGVEADLVEEVLEGRASWCRPVPFRRRRGRCSGPGCRGSLVRQLDQVGAVSEGERLLGADVDACRRASHLEAGVVAEDALLDHRVGHALVVVARDVERAGDHAVAAADADLGVVDDRAFLGLGVGVDEAGGEAGRLVAVVALYLAVDGPSRPPLFVLVDHGVGLGSRPACLLEDRLVVEGRSGSGRFCSLLQAASQLRQPMQRVVSTKTPIASGYPSNEPLAHPLLVLPSEMVAPPIMHAFRKFLRFISALLDTRVLVNLIVIGFSERLSLCLPGCKAPRIIKSLTGLVHLMAVSAPCGSSHLCMTSHATQMIGPLQARLILVIQFAVCLFIFQRFCRKRLCRMTSPTCYYGIFAAVLVASDAIRDLPPDCR